jgi:hypothetical protein
MLLLSHSKGSKVVTRRKFHEQDPCVTDENAEHADARPTWSLQFVHPTLRWEYPMFSSAAAALENVAAVHIFSFMQYKARRCVF